MENKETSYKSDLSESLIQNDDYFKYIFKKTEKIVCAVFYTVRIDESIRLDDPLRIDLETAAQKLMDISYASLRATGGSRQLRLEDVRYGLVILESKLTIMQAAHLLDRGLLEVFKHEIDSVQRTLRHYITNGANPLREVVAEVRSSTTDRRPQKPREEHHAVHTIVSTNTGAVPAAVATNRRDRVLSVIKDKVEATIKDISESITDCSEKTIQRELIGLIKDGIIVREGERRWSKYKLAA